MWTVLLGLSLWSACIGLAFMAGWLVAGGALRKRRKKEPEDETEAERRRRLQKEIVNFMRYDGTPQDKA